MNDKSRGNALPVTLIMLLVLTVLGIAGMRVAQSELRMTGAFQLLASAFFAAESAIETSLTTGVLTDGMIPVTDGVITMVPQVTGQTTRSYLARGPVPGGGYSIAGNTYAAYHFEAIATGNAPNNTNVTVVQGVYLIAHGGN